MNLAAEYNITRQALRRAKPRSKRQTKLEYELRDLMTRLLASQRKKRGKKP